MEWDPSLGTKYVWISSSSYRYFTGFFRSYNDSLLHLRLFLKGLPQKLYLDWTLWTFQKPKYVCMCPITIAQDIGLLEHIFPWDLVYLLEIPTYYTFYLKNGSLCMICRLWKSRMHWRLRRSVANFWPAMIDRKTETRRTVTAS